MNPDFEGNIDPKAQGGQLVGPSELPVEPMPNMDEPAPPPEVTMRGPAQAGPVNPIGRGEETPRERGEAQAALRRPSEPTPMAGDSFQAPSGGVTPFSPMRTPSLGSLATPSQGGLYGSLGGLQGGGLGVPLDATPDAASDPITMLIKLLSQGM